MSIPTDLPSPPPSFQARSASLETLRNHGRVPQLKRLTNEGRVTFWNSKMKIIFDTWRATKGTHDLISLIHTRHGKHGSHSLTKSQCSWIMSPKVQSGPQELTKVRFHRLMKFAPKKHELERKILSSYRLREYQDNQGEFTNWLQTSPSLSISLQPS